MFTVDKKKALCSSKHSIQEYEDEMPDTDNREIKTNNDMHLEEVSHYEKFVLKTPYSPDSYHQ